MRCSQENVLNLCRPYKKTSPTHREKIRRLAQACGVYQSVKKWDLFGWFKDPTSQHCKNLLGLGSISFPSYVSIDDQLRYYFGRTQSNATKITPYRGTIEASVFGLLYLSEKRQGNCILIGDLTPVIQQIQKNPQITLEETYHTFAWNEVGLVWQKNEITQEYNLTFPSSLSFLQEQFRQCWQRPSSRFILLVLTLVYSTDILHANIILYDKLTHTAERFEPYESHCSKIESQKLDDRLFTLFTLLDPKFLDFYGPPDLSFLPKIGIQKEQSAEKQKHSLDPTGFCQPWTFLYAELRMSFPNQVPNTIPDLVRLWVKENNSSLTIFIRNYSQNLYKHSRHIFDTIHHNPKKLRKFYLLALLKLQMYQQN